MYAKTKGQIAGELGRAVRELALVRSQLTQAQAELARLDKAVRDGRTVNYILVCEKDAEIAALREVVAMAEAMHQRARSAALNDALAKLADLPKRGGGV